MFPIEESQKWVFEDLIMDIDASQERSKNYSANRVGKRQQKLVAIPEANDGTNIANDNKQKAAHKEIEKKRRQDMAYLHASLRSVLPFEYIKGKRSMSDHIQESVNYIKHMEKTIEELKIKREDLAAQYMISNSNTSSSTSSNCFPISITVSHCVGGAEILINSGLRDAVFPLSRVLELLLEEGLDVVSCVSTQVNDSFLYTIRTEVSDTTCIDLSVLRQKLTNVIN
ncbi:hypothetical protein Vadar_023741 [Vaccinium darrowii]|uniref:Uncharacterized protein n=1 Tax=Vaccinium darrowii TaxID=229202 RepID=A0ACB7XKN3_9ERIC|nr:hypothetical protein Vadar_023741 [Vaccinium darrowii]